MDAFLQLHNRASDAESDQRLARSVELSEQALRASADLFPADSLVLAVQRFALVNRRFALASSGLRGAEQAAALRACWHDLEAGLAALAARADTRLRPDEAAFEVAQRENLRKRQPPGAQANYDAIVAALVPCLPYACVLWGGMSSFIIVTCPETPPEALRAAAQAAVLSSVDAVAAYRANPAAAFPALVNQEIGLAELLDDFVLSPASHRSAWAQAVSASWRRPSARGALRALGFAGGKAASDALHANFERDAAAKVAASGGLRRCGLPSCAKQELPMQLHFKRSACKHWTACMQRLLARCGSVSPLSMHVHSANQWLPTTRSKCIRRRGELK